MLQRRKTTILFALLCLFLASCASKRGCDCPSFGQNEMALEKTDKKV